MRTWFSAFVVLLLGGGVLLWWWRLPESTPALRGLQLARELGCFGCHGPLGQGGVADPSSPAGEIPSWQHATARLYVRSRAEVEEWILRGTTAREEARPARSSKPLIPMPAYADRLTRGETADLVACFLAISGWREEYDEEAWQGRKHAQRLGCFGCHGPSGMGGIENPGSFKGRIPPWDGEEFAELVQDEAELREWILFGRIERLWSNPGARHFLEGQEMAMPAYHDHLSDAELDELVRYIQSLREDSAEIDGAAEAAEVIG